MVLKGCSVAASCRTCSLMGRLDPFSGTYRFQYNWGVYPPNARSSGVRFGKNVSWESINRICCQLPVLAASHKNEEGGQYPPPGSDNRKEDEWIEIGIVGPPHGVRGEMKVQPLTDFPEERLGQPGKRWLQAQMPRIAARKGSHVKEVYLEWGRSSVSKGREVWLVKIEGIETPEDAAEIRGQRLLIPQSSRPPLQDEDEFYVQDLIGLKVVVHESGEEKGIVIDVLDGTGTHDVLRIQLKDQEQFQMKTGALLEDDKAVPHFVMLPFAKELVPVVDLENEQLRVAPPAGLWELASPAVGRVERKESFGKRERRKPRPRRGNPRKSIEQENT